MHLNCYCKCAYIYVCCTYVCMYVCRYVCMHVCVRTTCMFTHTYMYIYIYTKTHTSTNAIPVHIHKNLDVYIYFGICVHTCPKWVLCIVIGWCVCKTIHKQYRQGFEGHACRRTSVALSLSLPLEAYAFSGYLFCFELCFSGLGHRQCR